ncbi:MAG TPA: superoxide dismutase family protein [Anaeromyxobacter sp.]|nr:superoxide dismutase family protein [Anaeromyxobacter sp.]
MTPRLLLPLAASLPLALASPLATAAASPAGKAVLRNAEGKEVGSAALTSAKGGVKIQVKVAGLTPGKHGIHVHAVGKCEPPDFKSAGGHLNPAGKKHGLHSPEGAHAGDLPNLSVGKDGTGKGTFTAKGATLGEGPGSLFGPEGASLVVHADPDDEKTDPAGNSGARIACGVIERK